MHEISIAESLIEVVLGHLAASDMMVDLRLERVALVRVRVGVLSAIAPRALRTAFCQARRGTPLAGARLEVESMDLVVWCASCQAEKMPGDPRRLRCPDCGLRTPEVRRGLELELVAVELADATEVLDDASETKAGEFE